MRGLQIADVESLDPIGRRGESERLLQRVDRVIDPGPLVGDAQLLLLQQQVRISCRDLEEMTRAAARHDLELHGVAGRVRQRGRGFRLRGPGQPEPPAGPQPGGQNEAG